MKRLFKIILILAMLALAVGGIVLLVLFLDWPWWAGAALGLGLAGLVLGMFFFRKWLSRRRERSFVRSITDDEGLAGGLLGGGAGAGVLRARWQEAIDSLRRSDLKKRGQPLYVLPWYLMLGESGSGKTAAIKGSRLYSALTEVSKSAGSTGTANCDWWFFDAAIVLDTAGRYAVSQDEARDRAEWREFLMLLVRHRRKEPVNGLIVTVAADRLLSADADAISEYGRTIRRRLDELMRTIGARFPVYILVTKLDQVPGMGALGDLLSDDELSQALGQANHDLSDDALGVVRQAFLRLGDKFRELRLLLAHRHGHQDPRVLLFADQFARLQPNLMRFVEFVFEKNPYQESPALRGVYFASARQQAVEGALPAPLTDLQATDREAQTTFKGLFLRDFFGKILPADRPLFTPIAEYVRWQKVTRYLGLLAWSAIMLFICGLLGMSFVKNRNVIQTFTAEFTRSPSLTGDALKDMLLLKTFRQKIDELTELNDGWYLPRMGLDASERMEQTLKTEYCRLFDSGFIQPLDKSLSKYIAAFSDDTSEQAVVACVELLGTRIRLLTEKLNGDELGKEAPPAESIFAGVLTVDARLLPETVAKNLLPYYMAYLNWSQDTVLLERERAKLSSSLKQLAVKSSNMNWLVKWANLQGGSPVELADFWGPAVKPVDNAQVPPAFTENGRKIIEQFIAQYEAAVDDPEILKVRKAEFFAWYQREYLAAWKNLAEHFRPDRIQFESPGARREAGQNMAEDTNPYFSLLERLSGELKFLSQQERLPDWIGPVLSFPVLKIWANKPSLGKEKKKDKPGKKSRLPKSKDGQETFGDLERVAKEADRFKDYKKALADIAAVSASPGTALEMLSRLYAEPRNSPLYLAHGSFARIKNLYPGAGEDHLYLQLLGGPLRFLIEDAYRDAASEMQTRWNADVLAEVRDVPAEKLRTVLFDKSEGVVWKFAQGPAASFLGRDHRGYFAKTALSRRFPFNKALYTFLNKGSSQTQMMLPEYKILLKTKPTSVNSGALAEPFSTVLTLECSTGNQVLENLQFPASREFKWEPDKCGDVTLVIKFDDFSLTKKYTGPDAFVRFVNLFQKGAKVYKGTDFPAEQGFLKRVGVSEIRVKYAISGAKGLGKLQKKSTLSLPHAIVYRNWQGEESRRTGRGG